MASEWRRTALGAVARFGSGHRNSEEAVKSGIYPFFTCSTDVLRHSVYDFDTEAVIMAGNNAEARFHLRYFKGKFAARQRTYIIEPSCEELDCRFLYYALHGLQPLFAAQSQGTTTKFVTIGILKGAPINLPPLSEQRAIAHILGTLDDKIELNQRMNETLEAIARALFKTWFVDFDPVRAKAEGRDTGLPPRIADLYPDSFEDSELGEIPRGWEVSTIGDLCDLLTSGGTPARMTPSFWDGGSIPWFKTGELGDGPLLDSEEHITEAALASSSCKLWPAGTVLFALYASPTVGRLGVLTRAGTSNQAAAGLVAKASYGVPFLRRLLIAIRMELQSIAVGAAQQNINQAVLRSHRVVVPGSRLAGIYSRMMSPLDARQSALARESEALSALRDALLPKLISGELHVTDEERQLSGRLAAASEAIG